MKLQKGDKVRFLNDVGGGIITEITDKEFVKIKTEDGFEMPVLIKELIKVEEDQDFFSSSNITTEKIEDEISHKKKKKQDEIEIEEEDEEFYEKESDDINIYLAFLPTDMNRKADSDLDLYLINDSNYNILYNYQIKDGNIVESKPGNITANTKIFIDNVQRDKILNLEDLNFQFIFYKKSKHELKKVLEKSLKLNITKFFRETIFCENDFFDEPAYVHTVYEENCAENSFLELGKDDLKKIIEQKEVVNAKLNKPKKYQKNIRNMQIEIDLHIHELVDDFEGLKPSDILEIQMKHFESELEEAMKNPKITKAVFIHGIGNGTLKTELRRELDRKYKNLVYQDASFKEYGYGATLVHV